MEFKKIRNYIFYTLIFLRPFVSSYAFPEIEKYFLATLILLSLSFLKEICHIKTSFILNLSLILYLGGGFVSFLFSSNKLNCLLSFPIYFSGILFFLVSLTFRKKEIDKILKIIILNGIIVSLYGIYQYFFGFLQTAEYITRTEPSLFVNHLIRNYLLSKRVFSTFLSPNILAGYLIMIIPITMGYFLEKRKNLFYLISGIMLFVLLLTKSLGGILSLVISFIILIYLFKLIPPKKLSLIFIVMILFTIPITISCENRVFDFKNPHNSFIQRYNFIKVSLKILRDYPFQGIGMGNFGEFYMLYRKESDIRTNYAHNFILQILIEMGIMGGIGLLGLISLFLKESSSIKNDFSFLRFTLIWACFSFLLHNLIDISFFIPEVASFFWILLPTFKNLSK